MTYSGSLQMLQHQIHERLFTLVQCCGSGSWIRCLFEPWIRDGKCRIQVKLTGYATLLLFIF
jgi:hypothetical protein